MAERSKSSSSSNKVCICIYPPPSPHPLSNSQFLNSKPSLGPATAPYHQKISTPHTPNQNPQQKMLPSSPTTTTTTSISISLSSLFFLTILPTLTSALPTPLSPTTSDVEMITPALQFLPQRAVALTQGMETEMPMVTRSEETSDEEGSDDTDDTDDTEPDCKFWV